MNAFKLTLAKYFSGSRTDKRWLSLIEQAKNTFNNLQEFDSVYKELCDYVKSQKYTDQEKKLAFDRSSLVLPKRILRKRAYMQRRYNLITKQISQIKDHLPLGTQIISKSGNLSELLFSQKERTTQYVLRLN